eukprot:697622-Prymnesium_polylepis.1
MTSRSSASPRPCATRRPAPWSCRSPRRSRRPWAWCRRQKCPWPWCAPAPPRGSGSGLCESRSQFGACVRARALSIRAAEAPALGRCG